MKKDQRRRKRSSQQVGRESANTGSAKTVTATPASFRLGTRGAWIAVALAALILLVYAPVRHYGFVDLDDPQYVSENPFVANGVTWATVKWAFTSIHASYWLPLIWLSHAFDVQLYGLNAGGHHVTNVLLHTADTILLFALLNRTTGAMGRSAFVAALFAVHPLHVESVVWLTERKDVLSTLFLLLTIWTYVDYVRQPSRGRYVLSLAFFTLGLMSKAMLVTLPFMLLLLDVWPLERLTITGWPLAPAERSTVYRLAREKLPFLVLALLAAIATYLTQQLTGAVASTSQIPVAFRLENAMVSYVMYIVAMVWPSRLALFYPYPLALSPLLVTASVLGLIAVTVLVVRNARQHPYFAVGWLWYLGGLVPVIGFIQAGDQARADRFTYVPLIGLFIMIAWGARALIANSRVLQISGVSAVLISSLVASVQVGYWRTNTELWEHALRVADESYVAHTNLGLAVYARGKTDSAITEFRAALRLRPDFAEAYNDLGVALANRGDIDGAIQAFLNALRAKPSQAPSHYNAAVLLAGKGDTAAAMTHLQLALQLDPNYADAQRELEKLRNGQARR
ncbi:MAG TPA: tetratricopeptide repeat protein [Gemmatimonadaceae bacterium]